MYCGKWADRGAEVSLPLFMYFAHWYFKKYPLPLKFSEPALSSPPFTHIRSFETEFQCMFPVKYFMDILPPTLFGTNCSLLYALITLCFSSIKTLIFNMWFEVYLSSFYIGSILRDDVVLDILITTTAPNSALLEYSKSSIKVLVSCLVVFEIKWMFFKLFPIVWK